MHLTIRLFSALSQAKDAVKGTAKEIAKDAKRTTDAAKQTLQDDFRAVAQAVADSSDKIDKNIRGTDKERFQAAEEASKQAEQKDRKFVLNEHNENPFNKAAKMAHDTKEALKDKAMNAAESTIDATKSAAQKAKDSAMREAHSSEGYSEPSKNEQTKLLMFLSLSLSLSLF